MGEHLPEKSHYVYYLSRKNNYDNNRVTPMLAFEDGDYFAVQQKGLKLIFLKSMSEIKLDLYITEYTRPS